MFISPLKGQSVISYQALKIALKNVQETCLEMNSKQAYLI